MTRGGQEPKSKRRLQRLMVELQKTDCSIDDATINAILSYGDQAIPYLEAILIEALDCAQRGQEFPPRNTEWFKVIHALYLLAHLKSGRSLELVLAFLGQHQRILDYWLYELLDEDIWEIIFLLGQDNLQQLQAFLLEPKNNDFSKLATITALVQIALHFPDRASEVSEILRKTLQDVNEDPDFVGLVVSELMDLLDPALKSDVLQALDKNSVWSNIISSAEVEHMYQKSKQRKVEPLGILERYGQFRHLAYFSRTPAVEPTEVEEESEVEESA